MPAIPPPLSFNSLDDTPQAVSGRASWYGPDMVVPLHHHRRGQLLLIVQGTALIAAGDCRWMVPAQHALWIPPGTQHSLQMMGSAASHSAYLEPDTVSALPRRACVLGVSPLMRALMAEVVTLPPDHGTDRRAALIVALILEEVARLPELPLALPMPREARLAALCRDFVTAPKPRDTIDRWAEAAAMSRRAFTRAFREQTGLSLVAWRQQAALFAALPRLAAGESVTAVALDLGYESPAAFTTMFRRVLGQPPRRYLGGGAAS